MFDIKKILVPVDFSDQSKHAVQYALEIASKFQASIELIHVWEQPPYLGGTQVMLSAPGQMAQTIADFAMKKIEEDMEAIKKETIPADCPLTVTTRVKIGNVEEEVSEIAKEDKVDLIVVGTHGRSGVSHLLLGSVAEKLIRYAPCPVLTTKSNSEKE